ncbi:MAG: efflux RND transporter periplasmic adaptor subunit [Planctomycetota bacterium]|jgi:HlyD family secretion protein
MKRLKRVSLIAVLIVVVVVIWLLAGAQPVPVDVGDVTRGPVRSFVEEEGKTRVVERFVVSVPVAGRLQRVTLEEGDTVTKGDVVGEVDPLPLRSQVSHAEANIQALKHRIEGVETKRPKEAELERAKVLEEKAEDSLDVARRELEVAKAEVVKVERTLKRAQALVKSGSVTPEELDRVEAADRQARERLLAQEVRVQIGELEITARKLDTAILTARLRDYDWEEKDYTAQIAALESSLKKLRDDLQRTKIYAPVDGTVLNKYQESEQVVAAGTPFLELGDLSRLEVEADFLSEDVAHMRVGMTAEIFGRALGDRVIAGKIQRIYPSAFKKISSLGVEQQRVIVVVAFEKGAVPLGDRFRIEVRVILDQRADAVLVPEGALFRHRRRWHVFRIEENTARLAPVETGLRDGRVREVLDGLAPGASVILHPDDSIQDGTRVEPLQEE